MGVCETAAAVQRRRASLGGAETRLQRDRRSPERCMPLWKIIHYAAKSADRV